MDPLSVDSVSLSNDCSLESLSEDTDIQESKRGEYFKPINNEGLTILSDDSSLKDELCLQDFAPFMSSSMRNKAAWHPGEEIWDKFEFPNDAETERKKVTNLIDDTMKYEKGIEKEWDAETWDEPKADVFPKGIYSKEAVMWCPKSSMEEMLSLPEMQEDPVEEIFEAELVNTPNLLQQPPMSHCVSTMRAEQKCSPLKINQQKFSGNSWSIEVKSVPTIKFFVPSPNALHGVTSDNSMLLVKCSNTVKTSPTKTHLKNAILNTGQHQHFVTPLPIPSDAFTAEKNMVKTNCSNTVVAKSAAKGGLKIRIIETSAFSSPRKEQPSSMSDTNSSVENAYISTPSLMVEYSKRKGRGVRCGNQYSSAYTDEDTNLLVKRYIRINKLKRKRKILEYNKLMQQLRIAVPTTEHNETASRVLILLEAAKYCKEIPHIIEEQQKKLHELQSQQKKLRETLSLLHLKMAVERLQHSLYRGSI